MYPRNGSLSGARVYQTTGSAASRLVQMCRQRIDIDMWGPIVIDKAVRVMQQHGMPLVCGGDEMKREIERRRRRQTSPLVLIVNVESLSLSLSSLISHLNAFNARRRPSPLSPCRTSL